MKYGTISLVWLIIAMALSVSAFAQNIHPCEQDSLYRKLDFWVGEWDVVNEKGEKVGVNRIEKILDGCALMEHWRGSEGGEGKSLFYYNKASSDWKQVWITQNASVVGGLKEKHLIAEFSNGGVRFQGEVRTPKGTTILDRTTLTPLQSGQVRQVIEISRDGGTTWIINFDALYTRKK